MRGVGLAGGGYVVAQVLTLAAYLVLARLATPEDFGQFAAASVLVSVGLLFTESGMMAALIHRKDRLEEAASTATVATLAAGLGFGLIAFAASPLIGLLFESDRIGAVAAAVSGLIFLRSIPVVPEALLQRRFSFLRRVVIEPVGVVVFGVTAIIATSNDMGVWGLVIGYYAGAVVDVVLSWTLVGWRPRLSAASFAMWRELVSYGRHVLAGTTILRIGEQVPVVALGRFVGAGPLGQFRYADRIAATPYALVLAGASYVLFPAFARISHDRDRLRGAVLRSLRWVATIGFPLGMLLLPLGIPIAVTVFGTEWREAGEAAMGLCAFTGAAALFSVAAEAYKAAGRPDILPRAHAVTVMSLIVLTGALVSIGLVGVAIAVTVATCIGAIYALRRIDEIVPIAGARVLEAIYPAMLGSIVMAVALLALDRIIVDAVEHSTGAALALIATEAAIGLAIYTAVLGLLVPEMFAEGRDLLRGEVPGPGEKGATEPAPSASTRRVASRIRRTPAFSVVMPAHDAATTIEPAIRSVLNQAREDFELIVVDDGSRDDTARRVELLQSDERVKLFRQANAGLAAARNAGIARAGADRVAFLDSDDLWLPNYLEMMGAALDSAPAAGFAYTDGWWLDDSVRRIRRATAMSGARPPKNPPTDPEQFLKLLITDNFVLCSVTARREALEQVGGFRAEVPGVEDYDLWLRIVASGYSAVRAAGLLVLQRDRQGSMSKDDVLMLTSLRTALGRAASDDRFPDEVRELARRRQSRIERAIAAARGEDRARAAMAAIRLRLIASKQKLLPGLTYYRHPPREITEAFGDLTQL